MKDFIDFLKLPPNILGALSIASGTLLLFPRTPLVQRNPSNRAASISRNCSQRQKQRAVT